MTQPDPAHPAPPPRSADGRDEPPTQQGFDAARQGPPAKGDAGPLAAGRDEQEADDGQA